MTSIVAPEGRYAEAAVVAERFVGRPDPAPAVRAMQGLGGS